MLSLRYSLVAKPSELKRHRVCPHASNNTVVKRGQDYHNRHSIQKNQGLRVWWWKTHYSHQNIVILKLGQASIITVLQLWDQRMFIDLGLVLLAGSSSLRFLHLWLCALSHSPFSIETVYIYSWVAFSVASCPENVEGSEAPAIFKLYPFRPCFNNFFKKAILWTSNIPNYNLH